MSYSIEETEFGVLVTGSGIPVDDLLAMSKVWKKRGLTEMVPGVAVAPFPQRYWRTSGWLLYGRRRGR